MENIGNMYDLCEWMCIFCKESGKIWGKMKKNWENVW